jgi:hypothetical protein
MAKKNIFDLLKDNPDAVNQAGADAAKKTKRAPVDKEKRKLLQIPPGAHALAKKIAALDGLPMAEYVAGLILRDGENRYPGIK